MEDGWTNTVGGVGGQENEGGEMYIESTETVADSHIIPQGFRGDGQPFRFVSYLFSGP